MTAVLAWWGRVFTADAVGGNHTVVVLGDRPPARPAAVAAALGVPDTAFLTDRSHRTVTLRTFSPVEELAQCWQTALAVPVALGAADGQPWRVRHERGEELLVHREAEVSWARAESHRPVLEPTGWPAFVGADPEPGAEPVLLRQARSRVHLRCADPRQVAAVSVTSADVLALCASTGTSGLVLSAPDGPRRYRVRVFTTSLAGGEDSATGGAVLGVGLLAAHVGVRGDLTAVQGPLDPAAQGHLRLRLHDDATVWLGGEVRTLMTGNLEVR